MTESEVLGFVRNFLRSVWALELLLFLQRNAERSWKRDELIRSLRASEMIVEKALAELQVVGLVSCEADGSCIYRPATPGLDTLVQRVREVHAAKPMMLISAIADAPNEKLRQFSDAFKLKE